MHRTEIPNELLEEKTNNVTASADRASEFAKDTLRSGREIALFVYGVGDDRHRRKVYHLAETSQIPIFRLGTMLCARRSILMLWVGEMESKGWRRSR